MPPEQVIDQRIVKALAHPLRVRLLTLLNQKIASPRELSDELGEPIGNVSYHTRFLADLKMVELVRTEPRRGAVEHYYRAIEQPILSDDDWSSLPTSLRRSLSDSVLRQVARDLKGAGRSGGFDRDNMHLSRMPMVLDQQGWDELSTLLSDVLRRAEEIQGESSQRIGDTGNSEAIATALVLMQFEGATAQPSQRGRGA
jgi:DNA-binding transcriptional ArsR family regulator